MLILHRFSTSFLAELLNSLFKAACEAIFDSLRTIGGTTDDETRAVKYLRFICRCTSRSVEFSALAQDATTLLERLELPQRFPSGERPKNLAGRYYVPSLNSQTYLHSLKAALAVATEVQQRIGDVESEQRITKEVRHVGAIALEAIANVGLGTIRNEEHYQDMTRSMEVVSQRRKDLEVSLPPRPTPLCCSPYHSRTAPWLWNSDSHGFKRGSRSMERKRCFFPVKI